ncbi:MAG: InlB B-repeat-containing protein [Acholeplasmataceae bacterium]|jgi:uncharacterized repeat protein (TIGR02543 family)
MKNIMKKKIFPLLLLLLGLVFLVSCDKTGNNEKPVEKTMLTVIFDVNAGNDTVQNEPDPVRVESGKAVTKPATDPSRRGYTFKGWYVKSDGTGSAYDFSTPVTKNNFTLFAIWEEEVVKFTVTFDHSYDVADATVKVNSGQKVTQPTDPTRSGYRFEGWYIDENLTSKYNFSEAITGDLTLYAKWTQVFAVTFKFNYTGSPADVVKNVDVGGDVELPKTPTRTDYTFAGWYTDANFTQAFDNENIQASTTVYAKWIETSTTVFYDVTFKYNYTGAPVDVVQEVIAGGLATAVNTTRAGYKFLGWYKEAALQNRFVLTTPVESDLTLYAKWAKTYKLTLNYNYEGAVNPNPMVVGENEAITPPQNPARTGYTFAGWSNEALGLIGYNFESGIAADTTIYAQWSKVNVFEAEDLDFDGFSGTGFSGAANGTDAITYDAEGKSGASNNRFVTYLYVKGITLKFEIYSDRAVNNVELILRVSGELKDFSIQSHKTQGVTEEEPVYTVKVNGVAIKYPRIDFVGVPGQGTGDILPFFDVVLSTTVNLVEGKNTIELITDNELGMGGTMWATAPMVDCIKIKTYAILTWTPKENNY